MTAKPELEGENGVFALENAKKLSETAPARLACSDAEKNAANFLHETLAPYCDEVHEEIFNAHPSSGAFIYKAVCIMLTVSAVLFKCSEILGSAVWACIASPLSLAAFAIFAHKFFFDGTAADRFFLKKQSRNLIFKRLPRGTTLTRVVITADLDLPRHRRSIKLGKNTAYLLVACSVLCNTFTFCVCNAWLLCGAPEDSAVFSFLSSLCVLLCVFYILSFLLYDTKKAAGCSERSACRCMIPAAVMRQLSLTGTRYSNTEFCILYTGCGSSSHAGGYAFAKKHRRTFRDVPTVFISLEDICTSDELAVYFKETDSGSSEAASAVAEAAESIHLKAGKEAPLFGTPAHAPFTAEKFAACSFGTTHKHGEIPESKTPGIKAINDTAYILTQVLNYYDNIQTQ